MYESRVAFDFERIEDALGSLANQAPEALRSAVLATALDMASHAVTEKLLGQVLNRRTGTLIRSVTASPEATIESRSRVTGSFGTHLDYGRAHELGFEGTVQRPAHQRAAHVRQQRGRAVRVRAHTVRAHEARLKILAKRYLRDSLRERQGQFEPRLLRALVLLVVHGRPPTAAEVG